MPLPAYCQLDDREHISFNLCSKQYNFNASKCMLRSCLQHNNHLASLTRIDQKHVVSSPTKLTDSAILLLIAIKSCYSQEPCLQIYFKFNVSSLSTFDDKNHQMKHNCQKHYLVGYLWNIFFLGMAAINNPGYVFLIIQCHKRTFAWCC